MSRYHYPSELLCTPLTGVPNATCRVPGSKSITNRALVLAALAAERGACTLTGALGSEDTEVMVDSLQRLGFGVSADWPNAIVTVDQNRTGRVIPNATAELYVANSGTTMRFLTAMLGLGSGSYRLDGVPRMRERPIQDLLDALHQLGVQAHSETNNGCPPVRIVADGLTGGTVHIRAGVSSQFVSGLLMAAHFAPTPIDVRPDGPVVSEPYIEMTRTMLRQWGRHRATYAIEPDASAASYFFAAAAITGGSITVAGMTPDMMQGDVRFVDVLARMGCTVETRPDAIRVSGGRLHGVDVDMNAISDTVMTLAVVALFADGPTTIRNVGHIRHKETDRIAAVATELRKLGARVHDTADDLTIVPGPLWGCAVDTYDDHRMAMSLALVGLNVPGVVVRNPGCVAKTYPGYWQDLAALA